MLSLWKAFIAINLTTLFVIQYKECLISLAWHIPSRVLLHKVGAFALTVAKIVPSPTARHRFYSGFIWEILKNKRLHEMWEKNRIPFEEEAYISCTFCCL